MAGIRYVIERTQDSSSGEQLASYCLRGLTIDWAHLVVPKHPYLGSCAFDHRCMMANALV